MAGRIPEEKVDEIRERTDIVEVVSSYMPLKRSGANHQGLCPFHSEKTPSFNVNAPRQIFHCFGCGVGGNVFSFLMRMEGLSFPEAVRRLGERVGIEVEEQRLTPAEEQRRQERDRLSRVNEVAAEFYHQILLEDPQGGPARRYLKQRGYGGETARAFQLGFAPAEWEGLARHLEGKGFDPKVARQLGLIREGRQGRGDYDLFRNRLIFPIQDASGRVAAFGGRVLDDSLPKYINSSESPLYHKGQVLYGLFQAKEEMRRRDEVVVVEGYFDQLALHRAGFGHAVATCGTALTEEHGRLLKRYAKRVVLLFDQDRAGQQATFRAMDVLLGQGLTVAVAALEAGEDPDSFLQRHGDEGFAKRLEEARPVFEAYTDAVFAARGDSIEGKARAAEEVAGKMRLLSSDIERGLYLKALAERTGLDESLLRTKMQRPNQKPAAVPPRPAAPAGAAAPREEGGPPRQRPKESKAQAWLLQLMAVDAGVRGRVGKEGAGELFIGPDHRAVAEAMLECSPFSLEGLLHGERLSEDQKAIVSGILIKDDGAFADNADELFEGCRRATEKTRLKLRCDELKNLMRQTEQEGDWERHAEHQREFFDIRKRLEAPAKK
ncbi:DNA primase [uncultured Desulfuromonas sp.]|uniref:DNA primase n=1 Tax=uncultured Desulfuromonas sp. TaxID=181013 RepID=UPI0026218811|nr:DNA primase [uncultured Desulfuromonas sp.]